MVGENESRSRCWTHFSVKSNSTIGGLYILKGNLDDTAIALEWQDTAIARERQDTAAARQLAVSEWADRQTLELESDSTKPSKILDR